MPHPAVVVSGLRHLFLDPATAAIFLTALVGCTILTRLRPAYGAAALIVLDPFALYRYVGPTTVTLPKVALAGVALGLLLRYAQGTARTSLAALWGPRARLLVAAAALMVVATAVTFLQARYHAPAVRETLKACEYLAFLSVGILALADDPDPWPIRLAICGTATLVAVIALSEELTGAPSGIWIANHPIPRIAGPLEGPNQLSGYFEIGLPVMAALLGLGPARARAPLAIAFGVVVAADVLTLSRTGLLAGVVGLVVVLAFVPQAFRAALVAAAAGTVAAVTVLAVWAASYARLFAGFGHVAGGIFGHFASTAEIERSGGVGTRSVLWHAAAALWHRHPLLGIGAGNFELEIGEVGPAGVRTHANSWYLQSLVEGGLPLLAATLFAVYASIATFLKGPRRDPLVLGALAAAISLGLHQILDFLVFYPKVGDYWWLTMGIAVARCTANDRPAEPAPVLA